MNATVRDWQAWVPGGVGALATDLLAGRSRSTGATCAAADPERPEWLAFAHWRRMSRLTRAAAVATGEVLRRHDLDRDALPVVWGTAWGEVVPGSAALDRLLGEGPAQASPALFQDSVYNATLGRLAIAFGLQGPQETVCAGAATGLAAVARGMEWLDRAPAVLVVTGDGLGPAAERACAAAGLVCGEGLVAVLLARGDDLLVEDGVVGGPAPVAARGRRLPREDGFVAVAATVRPEATLGHTSIGELAALLVLGGTAIAQDDGVAITARRPSPAV